MTSGRGRLESRTVLVVATCVLVLLICDLAARLEGFRMPPVEWLFVGLAIGTACHELGHLMFAAIGSIPVRLISIGVGPLLWRARFGETWLELRVLPWSGFVAPYPLVNYRRSWWVLFVLGGVLGNVAVICLLAELEAVGATRDKAGDVLGAIGFAQVLIIVVSIIPFSLTVRGVPRRTDAMLLLKLLWQPQDEPAQNRAYYTARLSGYSRGNTQLTMSPTSSRILFHLSGFHLAADEDARHDVREALLRELEGRDLTSEERMWVLDALVTDGLVSRDPAVRPRLDDWSRQVLALGPDIPTLLGSRGAALVELGHYEAGKALLAPLAVATQAPPFDSFMNRAFLALAERALGNEAAAQQWANAARATAKALSKEPIMMAVLARLDGEMPPAKLQ